MNHSGKGKESKMREALVWETPEEMDQAWAYRVKLLRKRKKISQQQLSMKSGVSLGSIKRFEGTGQISLLSLTKIAVALDVGSEIRQLFTDVPYNSIEEVINENR